MATEVLRARGSIDFIVDKDYAQLVGGEKWQRVMQEIAVVAEGLLKSNDIPVVIDGDVHTTVHFHDGYNETCRACRNMASDQLAHHS